MNGKLFLRKTSLRKPVPRPGLKPDILDGDMTGPLTIVLLDMTWSKREFWIQAKGKLTNLMATASGKVVTVSLSPYSASATVHKVQKEYRAITLKALNDQANDSSMFHLIN